MILSKLFDCLQDKVPFKPSTHGFNMPLPLSYTVEQPGLKKFCEFLLPGSGMNDPALFLPYIPRCINACEFNGRQDIVSAPFSGCHLVLFRYEKGCLMSAIYGKGKERQFCENCKFDCETTCPHHKKTYAAHIAYEADEKESCKKIWEALKTDPNCKVYIDFNPLTPTAEKALTDPSICPTPSDTDSITNLYGCITSGQKSFNFAMRNNGEICFIDL